MYARAYKGDIMLIGCVCKPYKILLDGKPYEVTGGERLIGKFEDKDLISDDDIYFRGVVFQPDGSGGDGVILTRKEFNERCQKWVRILDRQDNFERNYYETWKNGGLINQEEVDNFANFSDDREETVFRAGFLVGLHLDKH